MVLRRTTARHTHQRRYRRPGGPWDVPALDDLLRSAGPRRDLVVDAEARLGSEHVEERVARLAGGLRARGVRRRDVVAWQAPNWHESVLLYRACWRLGAVAAPVHHQAGDADIDHVLGQVSPSLVLGAAGLPLATRPGTIAIRGAGDGFAELLEAGPVREGPARPSDLAAVLFTSGSAGAPKGVLHTHRALAYKALSMRTVHGLTPEDAVLMPAPLAHVSGLLNGILVPGVVPMKSVLMERWSPEAGLDAIERERITFMVGPPTFFVGITSSPAFAPERVRSLRLVSSGGAGVTPAFVDATSRALGAVVKRTYGSTEAPTVTTSHAGDDPVRAAQTDGRPTGDAEVRISAAGEVLVRGPELFVGYVDEGQTRAAFARGGWFRTGDLGRLEDGGWLTITGRIKDIIIRGGENISVAEVESVLEAHPAVRQAVAVGQPDDRLGERVAAFVVAVEPFDLETCRAWFAERGVATFKTPERVVRVDALPLLASGKPDRTALRHRLLAR